jgi:hypothetical protein
MPTNATPRLRGIEPGQELAEQTNASVLPRRRCASLTLAGEPCRAYPAADGWPWCSAHRYLHTRAAV